MANNLKYTEEEIGNVFANDAFHEHCQRPILEARDARLTAIHQYLKDIQWYISKGNPDGGHLDTIEEKLKDICEDVLGM